MKKSEIIINGIRAERFRLVHKYRRDILNDLVMVRSGHGFIEPYYRPQFKLESKRFKYKIGELRRGLSTNRKIKWRGFYIYSNSDIVKIYIDSKNYLLL